MDNTMNNELLPRKNGAIIFLECILIDIAILIAYALLRDKVIFQIANMMCSDSDYMVVALITCYVISFVFLIPLCFYLKKELKREIQESHRIKWYKHVVRLFIDSLVVILLFLTIYATIGYLARDIFARIQINDSMQDYFSVSPVASFIYVCLLGPIVEELIFRGFIYKQMKDINKLFSIVLSSGLFAVMHQYYD
ncbi:CPBP family intramembrane glutamic endopeptidase, partial [Pseudobutyrivibrio sp.]